MRKEEERIEISRSGLKRTKEMLKYSVQNEVEGDRDKIIKRERKEKERRRKYKTSLRLKGKKRRKWI
jgi:hypothetical protein